MNIYTDNENKQKNIINMFESIAKSYDKANRIMSMGIDSSWRKEACAKAVEALNSVDSQDDKNLLNIVDIACGTGDMVLCWANAFSAESSKKNSTSRQICITGIDPSAQMLDIARQKCSNSAICSFMQGEAKKLDIASNSVDILSIAYGLRNVVELDLALQEFARVLKPSGVLVILEFMNNDNSGFLNKLMRFYTRNILPFIGGIISKNYAAYKYLPDSINCFVSLDTLAQKLDSVGIKAFFTKGYSADISTLYIGAKI